MNETKIMPKVFLWMFIGLAITFLTGSYIANRPTMILEMFKPSTVLILFVVEIVLVVALTVRIHKMNPITAKIMFMLYSFVTGITFSSIFVVYNISSIIYIFLATSLLMLIFALIGYFTKMDLTKIGTFLFMAIIGILIMCIINMFVGNENLNILISIISVIVFVIYIAYDVQKVKKLYMSGNIPEDNVAIYGALQLYLDFINIFLDLLRLFGDNN
ncbi:MAG: Bax inhibitor-1/YccA family protein [Bacilli bacterium]|nr:Bax inhibitor-1/YccA family protein [Bacilli bacterium]